MKGEIEMPENDKTEKTENTIIDEELREKIRDLLKQDPVVFISEFQEICRR